MQIFDIGVSKYQTLFLQLVQQTPHIGPANIGHCLNKYWTLDKQIPDIGPANIGHGSIKYGTLVVV